MFVFSIITKQMNSLLNHVFMLKNTTYNTPMIQHEKETQADTSIHGKNARRNSIIIAARIYKSSITILPVPALVKFEPFS